MRDFTLNRLADTLDKQVLHMDQGLCYNPEFRATRRMHDYPSRKFQLARLIFTGELEASDYIARIVFNSILSRQGERWQNFGESPEECTDVMFLCRELLGQTDFVKEILQKLQETLNANGGHILDVTAAREHWARHIPVDGKSRTCLLLDDGSCVHGKDSARAVGEFLSAKGIGVSPYLEPLFPGFEYFAYGLIDRGIEHLTNWIKDLEERGIDRVITLCGQTQYLLDVLAPKLGITSAMKTLNLLDLCSSLQVDSPVYLYAGSFALRYLGWSQKINGLLPNTFEKPLANCAEFTPLYEADRRINKLTIWQKPLCAEYLLLGIDKAVEEGIRDDALADIRKAKSQRVLVFEPFAWERLVKAFGRERVFYYTDALKF